MAKHFLFSDCVVFIFQVSEADSKSSANFSYTSIMSNIDDVGMENASESEKVMHLVQSVQLISALLNAGEDEGDETVTSGQSVQPNQQEGDQSQHVTSGGSSATSTGDGQEQIQKPSPEKVKRAQVTPTSIYNDYILWTPLRFDHRVSTQTNKQTNK